MEVDEVNFENDQQHQQQLQHQYYNSSTYIDDRIEDEILNVHEEFNNIMKPTEYDFSDIENGTNPVQNVLNQLNKINKNLLDDSFESDPLSFNNMIPMSLEELQKDNSLVAIDIPKVYINVDNTKEDKYLSNIRCINYEVFSEYMKIGKIIFDVGSDKLHIKTQLDICEQIIKKMTDKRYFEHVKLILEVSKAAQFQNLQDQFFDMFSQPIDFDRMRVYETNDLNMMINYRDILPEENNNICFYSQLNGDKARIREYRMKFNDTDLNRAYYILHKLTQTMIFDANHLCSSTLQMVNVCFLFDLLCQKSKPLEQKSLIDLTESIYAFVFDLLARTRVIGKWLSFKHTAALMTDIKLNYNQDNILVRLCSTTSEEERINICMNYLKNQLVQYNPVIKPKIESFSYKDYMNIVENYKETPMMDDNTPYGTYYNLSLKYLMDVINLEIYKHLSSSINDKNK